MRSRGGTFGNSKRGFASVGKLRKKESQTPGPGAYRVPVKIANLPNYALPAASEEFKFV